MGAGVGVHVVVGRDRGKDAGSDVAAGVDVGMHVGVGAVLRWTGGWGCGCHGGGLLPLFYTSPESQSDGHVSHLSLHHGHLLRNGAPHAPPPSPAPVSCDVPAVNPWHLGSGLSDP